MNGLTIIVSPMRPKMQLSEDVPVSPEFRKEMNTWMSKFFGMHCLVPKGQMFHFPREGKIVMHPEDFHRLRKISGGRTT